MASKCVSLLSIFPLNLSESQPSQPFRQRTQQTLFVCIQAEQIRKDKKDKAIGGNSRKQFEPRIKKNLRLDQKASRHANARNQRKPREIFPEGEDINLFFFLVIDVQYQAFHQKKGGCDGNGVARHAVILGPDNLPGKAQNGKGEIGVGSKFKVVARFADVPPAAAKRRMFRGPPRPMPPCLRLRKAPARRIFPRVPRRKPRPCRACPPNRGKARNRRKAPRRKKARLRPKNPPNRIRSRFRNPRRCWKA